MCNCLELWDKIINENNAEGKYKKYERINFWQIYGVIDIKNYKKLKNNKKDKQFKNYNYGFPEYLILEDKNLTKYLKRFNENYFIWNKKGIFVSKLCKNHLFCIAPIMVGRY